MTNLTDLDEDEKVKDRYGVMRSKYGYDMKCEDLASDFLMDQPEIDTPRHRRELAQNIQDVIETWLSGWNDEAEVKAKAKAGT